MLLFSLQSWPLQRNSLIILRLAQPHRLIYLLGFPSISLSPTRCKVFHSPLTRKLLAYLRG
ncbi:hypothetical protein FOWG_18038 [Fusarium oxysporum f. sp. lycopersici MN25]|nr:hypothetical protein FOWG_18038 [Fusarium oxysporum f. sp. lycopersici MN25]